MPFLHRAWIPIVLATRGLGIETCTQERQVHGHAMLQRQFSDTIALANHSMTATGAAAVQAQSSGVFNLPFAVSNATVIGLAILIAVRLWADASKEDTETDSPRKETAQEVLQRTRGTSSVSKERPSSLLGDIVGAGMALVVELVNCISVALIVLGDWPKEYMDVLFRHATYGFLLTQLCTTMVSKFPGVLAPVGFENLTIMMLLKKKLIQQMSTQKPEVQVITFLACSSITTLLSSAMLALMAIPQMGRILNMFPQSLRTGVFAAVGIGIFMFGFSAFQIDAFDVDSWAEWPLVLKWLPAFILGLTLWAFDQYYWSKWLFLVYVILVVTGVHILLAVLGVSLGDAAEKGWLLGRVQGRQFYEYHLFLFNNLADVDWTVVRSVADRMLTAAFVGPVLNVAINILLLEPMYKTDCSYSREFLSQALGACVSGLSGGWNSYVAVGDTNTMRQAGGRSRRAALFMVLMMAAVCAAPPLLPCITSIIPNLLIGSICVYGGFWIAKGCLIDDRSLFSTNEYLLVLLTCGLCLYFSVLDGLRLGFVIMTFTYMIRGANADYLKYMLSLRECRSIRSYAPKEEEWLHKAGSSVVVAAIDVQLISVFTDPAHIWRQIQTRVQDSSAMALLVDFAGVNKIDSTSIQTFVKMLHNIQPCVILLANVPNSMLNEHKVLQRNLHDQELDVTLFIDANFTDEERSKDALIFAEQILISKMPEKHNSFMPFLGLLSLPVSKWPIATRLMARIRLLRYVLKLYLPKGSIVFEPRCFYYFAVQGRCSFVQFRAGDVVLQAGAHVDKLFILAGGLVLAKEKDMDVAEYCVVGELLSPSSLFASSSTTLIASSQVLVMCMDLTELANDAKACPPAALVLQHVMQEVSRLQHVKMSQRIQLLTGHATQS
mmetsp:Transcript_88316/g.152912  ORF Transcript_88316/g.152912 Transcript_88316/m.152912 type:complete len:890 (+) Transcript_88316:44-2713(+)